MRLGLNYVQTLLLQTFDIIFPVIGTGGDLSRELELKYWRCRVLSQHSP